MLESIQNMSHEVRTEFGDSSTTYRGSNIPEGLKLTYKSYFKKNDLHPKYGIYSVQ